MQAGHHVYLLSCAGDGYVQAVFSSLLVQAAKVHVHVAFLIGGIGGREDDDVFFVSLNVFYVFHDERFGQREAVLGGKGFEIFKDEYLLPNVEGDYANFYGGLVL